MSNGLTKSDLSDIDFIDSCEILSDGYNSLSGLYLESTLVGTTTGTNVVEINYPADQQGIMHRNGTDHPAETGDYVYIYGTGGADGYYIIDTVLSDTTFSTTTSIVSSTGGNIQFFYPPGASKIGIDSADLTNISANNLQSALKQIDQNLGTGGPPSGAAGGDLSGTYPNPDVVDLTIASEEQGSVLYFNGTNWIQLPPGTSGYVLTTHDAGSNPTWEDPGSATLPTADECGQFLISEEDNVFRPNYPMVGDASGCILMGDNAKIIICG